MAKEYDLIQTENPYVDRVVYYLKNLASGCVIKNPTEVLNNETLESLRNADLYTHAVRGELNWTLLDLLDEIKPTVTRTALGRTVENGLTSYYDEIIDAYILDQKNTPGTFWNFKYVSPFIEFLATGRVSNNDNDFKTLTDVINYLEDFKGTSFIVNVDNTAYDLTYESTFYNHVSMVQSGKHNLLLIPRNENGIKFKDTDGNTTIYSDYSKGYAINSNEDEQNRFIKFATKYIINNYVERNNYYRMLAGRPSLSENYEIQNRIYLGVSSDIEQYSITYDNKTYVDVFNAFIAEADDDYLKSNPEAGGNETLFGKTYIDELTDDQIQILKNYKVIDNLLEVLNYDWNYKYLNFLGSDRVDPIKARSTVDFGYLHINSIDNENIYNRFKDRLDLNRIFVIRTIYSDAYKYGSDFYDHFICILIIILSLVDVITLLQEIILNKEVLDQRIIKYIFESNGIPYYSEIPLNYQVNMVKNLNTLIKYKSSNRNIVDICSLFGFDNIEVFKYYLLKTRKTDENGNFIVIDKDKSNINEAYDLKFIKVPYDGNVVDYINDKEAEVEYEKMISGDPTWNAGKSTEYVKQQILQKEFNLVKSKYISIDSTFDIAEATTQIAYLMDLMYVDKERDDGSLQYFCKSITVPFQNSQIPIGDMFLYLFALTFAYYGTKSSTPTEFGYNASVLNKSITGTAYDTTSRSDRYLAFDINQDLARLATMMQAKLNKNMVISRQTYAVGDTTETKYILQLSGFSKTFELTEDEWKSIIDSGENLYIYSSMGNEKIIQFTEAEMEEALNNKREGTIRPYIITHTFSNGDYDSILLTKEEFHHYLSDIDITKTFEFTSEEWESIENNNYSYTYSSGEKEITITFSSNEIDTAIVDEDGNVSITHYYTTNEYQDDLTISYPKSRMFFDPNEGENGAWKNIISVYYYEENEVIDNESLYPNTLYIINNQTQKVIKYKHPIDPFLNVPDLYEFLNNDSDSSGVMINRELLQTAMIEANSIEEYNMYKWVYDSIMISDRVKSYFYTGENNEDGTPKYYQDYKSYLAKYAVLWGNLDNVETMMEDITMEDSIRKETISTLINNAISALESVDFSQYFEYAYNGIATVSGDYLASYIVKLIEFFKSYKVDIYDINAVYKFDDKFNNTVIMIDQIDRINSSLNGLKEIHYDAYDEISEKGGLDKLSAVEANRVSPILNVFKPADWESPNGILQNRNVDNGIMLAASDSKAFLSDKFSNHSAIFDILSEMLKYKGFDDNYHPELLSDEYNPKNTSKVEIIKYNLNDIPMSDINFTGNVYVNEYIYEDYYSDIEYYEIYIELAEITGVDGYDTFFTIKTNIPNLSGSVDLSYYTYNEDGIYEDYEYNQVGKHSILASNFIYPNAICVIPKDSIRFANRKLEVDIYYSYSEEYSNFEDTEIIMYRIKNPVPTKNITQITLSSNGNYGDTVMAKSYDITLSNIKYLYGVENHDEQYLTHLIISAQRYLLDGSIDTESGKYFGLDIEDSNGVIRKILYSYAKILMQRTFGTIENVNDLITKINVKLGSSEKLELSEFMNDKYSVEDIMYLAIYYTTRIFLTNKVLTIVKFDEETQTQKRYESNTDNWQDPNWVNMNQDEKEEFYKELEVLDDIILKTSIPIDDKYYDALNDGEKHDLEILVKSLSTILKFSSKELYEQANRKDDMNFDDWSKYVFRMLTKYTPEELYAKDYMKEKIIDIISDIVFGKDTYKNIDISKYRSSPMYYTMNQSNCIKYLSNPITGETVTSLHPIDAPGGSYTVYKFIPVDFAKYRYYYTKAKSNTEVEEPSNITLYYIGYYTNRWDAINSMNPYKEMVYTENFKILPDNYGFYEIKLNEGALNSTGFEADDIKYITFSMYNDSEFKLYRCLRENPDQDSSTKNNLNLLEYDSTAEMIQLYDEFHCNMDFKTGEITTISDLFGKVSSGKKISDAIELADQIYIEEA